MSQVKDIAVKCFRDEAQAILDLIPQLDEHFDAAVDLMLRCTGKVIITGVGKSGHIGAKMPLRWRVRGHRLFSSIRWMSSMATWG